MNSPANSTAAPKAAIPALALLASRDVPDSHFDLSFVRRRPRDAASFWAVEYSGDYAADCDRGHALGAEYLAYVGRHPKNASVVLLGWIVGDMLATRSDGLSGVEIGFLHQVNQYAIAAASLMDGEAKRLAGKPEAAHAAQAQA